MTEQPPIPESSQCSTASRRRRASSTRTERHIERLVEQGALGHCRVGRFVMFREEDLNGYLDRTHVDPKAAE